MGTAASVLALALSASSAAAGTHANTPSSDGQGSIGLKLLDAPLEREADPRAHMYIVDHLAPGSLIHRRVQVTNTSDVDQRVDLYAASAEINSGSFAIEADRTPNELTTWISVDDCVSDADVTDGATDCGTPQTHDSTRPSTGPSTGPANAVREVPAHGAAVVRVTVRVPPKASAGERYAVLWAQVAGPADRTSNVRLVSRVGVRLYLDIGPGGDPPSDFRIEELTPARSSDGTPRVVAKVRNTGKRALDLTGSMSLADGPGSLSAGPFAADLGTTLGIGDTEPVTVPLDRRIPNGPWKARLTLASGLIHRTVMATLTFPGDAGAGASVTPTAGDSASMTATLIVGLSLLFLLAVFGYRTARRRRVG
ncbi:hypothetical protein [Streptacidiphilus rugosus]|uniref:hypothetical protein n=1 Tax=Streptacidiphilus rugosus TaxID=405783 RepID=UPI00056A7790|nr:hypothetical protein [Streptacidiphilus rugosus]